MKVGAVVPAAGSGSRFGSTENKIWADLLGKPVLEWSVRAFVEHRKVDAVVVVAAERELERMREAAVRMGSGVAVVAGGATRTESVYAGLRALPNDVDVVLVHDAARPAVTSSLIDAVLEAVVSHGAAVPGTPIADTVKRSDEEGAVIETVDRRCLWAVQTPQGARRDWLMHAYAALGDGVECTDEAGLLEKAGYSVHIVPGDADNVKVTVPEDLRRAEAVLRARRAKETSAEPHAGKVAADSFRTGIGYDVHRLCAGRPLWLGGVEIPHTVGLAGHSDADVMMHAVCDAILGAIGEGDIGVLFPDTDEVNRNRRSAEFVAEAANRALHWGWEVMWIDITLVAEEPRIGAYRSAMRAAIASAAGVEVDRVSIKATTNEGMGFVGRREGIACWAVASLCRRPAGDARRTQER